MGRNFRNVAVFRKPAGGTLWTRLKATVAHPRHHHTNTRAAIYAQPALHMLVFDSLVLPPPLDPRPRFLKPLPTPRQVPVITLSFSLSLLCLSVYLPLSLYLAYSLCVGTSTSFSLNPAIYPRPTLSPAGSFRTWRPKADRSDDFPRGFPRRRRPPRDESRNCSQGSRFERGKKFRSIERTLARGDTGERVGGRRGIKGDRMTTTTTTTTTSTTATTATMMARSSNGARRGRGRRKKKRVPKRSADVAALSLSLCVTDLRRRNKRGHGLEKEER